MEQELSDTREQVVDLQNSNGSLTNAKRKLDSDIHQIQASVGSIQFLRFRNCESQFHKRNPFIHFIEMPKAF